MKKKKMKKRKKRCKKAKNIKKEKRKKRKKKEKNFFRSVLSLHLSLLPYTYCVILCRSLGGSTLPGQESGRLVGESCLVLCPSDSDSDSDSDLNCLCALSASVDLIVLTDN
jgi:hypothetical protein